jgi:hypothetical protein
LVIALTVLDLCKSMLMLEIWIMALT